jgi:hypothetical protein
MSTYFVLCSSAKNVTVPESILKKRKRQEQLRKDRKVRELAKTKVSMYVSDGFSRL